MSRPNETLRNHRGPFRLEVTRPSKGKAHYRTEWLPGEVDRDDVVEEALSLLDDPRDTIIDVGVWSVREQAYATIIRRGDTR